MSSQRRTNVHRRIGAYERMIHSGQEGLQRDEGEQEPVIYDGNHSQGEPEIDNPDQDREVQGEITDSEGRGVSGDEDDQDAYDNDE